MFDLLVQLRAFDGDGRKVGQRRQEIEILFGEAADVNARVDLHGPDHAVAVPERDAHRGADLLDPDRLPGLEPTVRQGVRGEHRDPFPDDRVDDGVGKGLGHLDSGNLRACR